MSKQQSYESEVPLPPVPMSVFYRGSAKRTRCRSFRKPTTAPKERRTKGSSMFKLDITALIETQQELLRELNARPGDDLNKHDLLKIKSGFATTLSAFQGFVLCLSELSSVASEAIGELEVKGRTDAERAAVANARSVQLQNAGETFRATTEALQPSSDLDEDSDG